MEVLDHQKAALAEIVSRGRAFFATKSNHWQELPVKPRWATIVCAPTGVGKTALAMMAARALGASMLRVPVPSWIPCGAHQRGARETICVIANHIARNDHTILVLDEIDKLLATNNDSWQGYIRGEIYELLDGRWPTGMREVEDEDDHEISIQKLTIKLNDSVFFLSIGTFQNWFDTSQERRAIGFCDPDNAATEEITAEAIAGIMPRELANRHNSSIIRMPELTAKDYRNIAQVTTTKLPLNLQQPFRQEVERRIDNAIAAKKGVRFLEEAMMAVLIGIDTEPPQILTPSNETTPSTDITTCTL